MVRVKIPLVSVLGLSLMVLFVIPVKTAFPDELVFKVVNPTSESSYINCEGPFFRRSGCIAVDGFTIDKPFYSAEINEFSPYGKWTCRQFSNDICFPFVPPPVISFCVTRDCTPGNSVQLQINRFNVFSCERIGLFELCPFLSTNSFLGDRPQQSRPDRDTFSFDDTEGDQVTLRLEEDGSAGHTGKEANFKFRGPIGSASLDEFRTGELPLEITATVPESGEYEIVVDQKNIPNDLRYRGGYVITLDHSLDDVKEIVPSQDVE